MFLDIITISPFLSAIIPFPYAKKLTFQPVSVTIIALNVFQGASYMAVTIKDVAALAGVSTSTVSRVCNNNPAISRETQERVRKAMAELGYEGYTAPDNSAAQPIKMIGIILPPVSGKSVGLLPQFPGNGLQFFHKGFHR